MKKLSKYFFEGLIVVIPVSITIYLLYIIFIQIDGLFKFKYPGIGFLITMVGILVIGFIASHFLTKGFIVLIHNLFNRVPLVKIIYISIKDLTEALFGERKKFNQPVSVRTSNDNGVELLGFITEENPDFLGEKDKVAVYIPQAYNFAGNLILVPIENVKKLNVSAKEMMTFIVSGGLSTSNW
ncbi:MAG: hypothetical protein A2315_01050 [Ignavibacteria bacterium RIFOXYB2_FULL_35_12]|nr:MAG: hypothetical protein A2058_16435 [Ignavibacteria bacterium GWA2_36_19]OGU49681.1 MAG: hypothetical protein A2006_05265 [Ignavibacteria bacterium GWC2_35_8]OGU62204.1 MAG: hypothetical protein A2X60_04120 [Ignavibacteria bacterium GWF2_35_20]OGU81084.1 MAG: hypothetical protein A2254_14460 [Ignavibacteria bacterium RIFOXYA2_FULL_35_9]OGU84317.1 MAG: hypothetical protein A2W11_14955 [Ignavibacteria bacterium RBG_16_35_7]OGU84610.1 MAG: hypothetical protein A3K31_09250 [Ignavibacteria bac